MARVVVVAIALALVAVLAPSPLGAAQVARIAAVGHSASAGSEEEPTRECRTAPEPRSCSTRTSPARPAAEPRRSTLAPPDRDDRVDVAPPVRRGRVDHLRSWSTPSALQVFRH